MPRYIILGASVCLAALAAGCGPGGRYKVVPVEGRIAFDDGRPLPAGTRLLFNPHEGRMGTASAVTDADGGFTVKHVSGSRGAELGKYVVLLRAPEGDDGGFLKAVPKDYWDGGALVAEVTEKTPTLDLKVKRAAGR